MFEFPNAKLRARALKEQMLLTDELWAVFERATARWDPDPEMTDKMVAAVLMAAVTTFSGSTLAMVANAMGMEREALKGGAELIGKGALSMASLTLTELQAEEEAKSSSVRH